MTPNTIATNLTSIPLPRFILALSLLKSKPRALSLREYITGLFNCIRDEPRSDSYNSSHHIDTIAFWREKYTQSEEAQIALRARIISLESEQRQGQVSHSNTKRLVSKRKLADAGPSQTPSNKAPKQARTARVRSPILATGSQSEVRNNEVNSSMADEESDICLRHLFILQQVLSQNSPATSSLCEVLHQLSSHVTQSIFSLRSNFMTIPSPAQRYRARLRRHASVTPPNEELSVRAMTALNTLFPFLIQGLDRLCKVAGAQASVGSVVYCVVRNFQELIDTVCDIVAVNSRGDAVIGDEASPTNELNFFSSNSLFGEGSSRNGLRMSANLCKIAISWIGCLDPRKREHRNVLDGFLYFLLTRVGQNINKLCYFTDRDGTRMHVNGDYVHGGEEDLAAVKAPAPYLTWMLKGALQIASNASEETGAPPSPTDSATTDSSHSNGISQIARTKLQHTVFKAVFGEKMFDDFPLSLKALENPAEDRTLLDLGKDMKLEEARDWYTAEVWRLVGWDVLRGMLDWPRGL